MKLIKILTLLFLSANCILFTQVQQEWVARYNGTANNLDEATSLALDGNGNIYVTGWSQRTSTGRDYVTIKYNSLGSVIWERNYDNPGDDYARFIAVDNNGNAYVTGLSTAPGVGYDYATLKYSSNGDLIWVQRYNGTGNATDEAKYLVVDESGNVYVTGYSYQNALNCDYATVKYNSNGIIQWVQRYNGTADSNDAAFSLDIDLSGNVYVTGESKGSNTFFDFTTIKYSSSGIQQWVRRYNETNQNDQARSIKVDNAGYVFVTGYSVGNVFTDCATIKYDSSGTQLWIQRYDGGSGEDGGNSIYLDNVGNTYITGFSSGIGTHTDFVTIKYNSQGIEQWVRKYNGLGNGNDIAYSITVDNLLNVYITGSTEGTNTLYDYTTIKYDHLGVFQWIERYNGPNSDVDVSVSIANDSLGNIFITGYSRGNGTFNDYATIKYSQPLGITPISNEIPLGYVISQNYPNPFNPATNINFQLPVNSFVKIVVFDMLGREVEALVSQNMNAGTYKVDWDASKYSSGIYYYKITAGEFTETKKMILVK